MSGHSTNDPVWWSEAKHGGAWARVKDALRRDWEQTKSDVTGGRKGAELDQDASDTVRQAVGRARPEGADEWNRVEAGYRYGAGAAHQFPDKEWDQGTESKLREEWNDLKSGRTWEEMKDYIRRGWIAARGRPRSA